MSWLACWCGADRVLYRDEKVLFVHVPKTAGQSIEHFFLARAGLNWEERGAFLMGPNDDPARGPRRLAHLLARQYVACGHMDWPEFDACFKFGFVRHPVSRALSMFKYQRVFRRHSFREYVNHILPERAAGPDNWFHRPQVDFLCDDDGEILVDFIGRFEALERDFATVCASLGIAAAALPHVNESLASDHRKVAPGGFWAAWRRRIRASRRERRWRQAGGPYEVPPLQSVMADRDLTRAVAEIYPDDFSRFGYDPGKIEVLPPLFKG